MGIVFSNPKSLDVMVLVVIFEMSVPCPPWLVSLYVPAQSSDAVIYPLQQNLFYSIALLKILLKLTGNADVSLFSETTVFLPLPDSAVRKALPKRYENH